MEQNEQTPLSHEERTAKLESIVAELTKRITALEGAFELLEEDVDQLKADAE